MKEYARNWKGFLLLSLIVPIGIFTAVKLSGIGQPADAETTTLSTINWEFARIAKYVGIEKELNTTFEDACQMVFSTSVVDYAYCRIPGFSDVVRFWVGFTVSPRSRDFRLNEVRITLKSVLGQSRVELIMDTLEFENLSFADYSSHGQDVYVHLVSANSPEGASFRILPLWNLYSPNNVTEQREIDFEITYFNGTAYRRVVQPFVLTLIGT